MDWSHPSQGVAHRVPSPAERALGLWVDRVGMLESSGGPEQPRALGLFAVVYILHGSGVFCTIPSKPVRLHPGRCFVLFPTVPHVYMPDDTGWTQYWIVFDGRFAEPLVRTAGFTPRRPVMEDRMGTVLSAHEMLGSRMDFHDTPTCYRRFVTVCGMLRDLCVQGSRSEESGGEARDVGLLVDHINTHFTDPSLSIADMVRTISTSYSHARRLFRKRTGRSIKRYLLHKRLERAGSLLADFNISIREVAHRVGYEDEYYFMRLFRKEIGVSPGRFRRSLMEERGAYHAGYRG